DLSHLEPGVTEAQLASCTNEEARRPFDLQNEWPFRVLLLRLGEAEHLLVLNLHHIVSDRWSSAILTQELSALYAAFVAGRSSPLPELFLQYADFACWQRQWLQGEAMERHLSYWKQRLAGVLPRLELPSDRMRPGRPSFQGTTHHFRLSADLTDALKTLSHREGTTLFM